MRRNSWLRQRHEGRTSMDLRRRHESRTSVDLRPRHDDRTSVDLMRGRDRIHTIWCWRGGDRPRLLLILRLHAIVDSCRTVQILGREHLGTIQLWTMAPVSGENNVKLKVSLMKFSLR